MKRMLTIAVVTIALTSDAATAAAPHPTSEPHPAVPQHPTWVKGALTGILMLFAFAIPVGIIIRANMPDPPPGESHDEHGGEAHGHGDDSDGAGRAHGHGGTHH
jgi:hypothetical protein